MGCSQSSPAFKGPVGPEAGSCSRQANHDYSTFSSEEDSHPRTVSSEARKDCITAAPRPKPATHMSARAGAKRLTTASSTPPFTIHTAGSPVAKDTVWHCNSHSEKTEETSPDPSCAQENTCVAPTLVETQTDRGRRVSAETPRRRCMKEASLRTIKVNCARSGQNGALCPRKATQAPHFDSVSALGTLLVIDAPLSPRRSVALAAVAAACRTEGITSAKIPIVTERKLTGDKGENTAQQSKEFAEIGVDEANQNAANQGIPDLKETFASNMNRSRVRPESSPPDASPFTATHFEETETGNAVRDCATSEKRPSILQRIKSITPKLTDQVSCYARLHQLLHQKMKNAVDLLHLSADDTSPAATAVAPEVTLEAVESHSKRLHQEEAHKPKLSCGLLSFATPGWLEKKRCEHKERFPSFEGRDARKRSCYASVESAKATVRRQAEALRASILLVNASRKCAFLSSAAFTRRSHAREASCLQRLKRTQNSPCQSANTLVSQERVVVRREEQPTKQTVRYRECCLNHAQVNTTQTALVTGGVAAAAPRETGASTLTRAPFANEGDKTGGETLKTGCCGFERETGTSAFQQHLREPSADELRAVWCVMKIGAAKTREQKAAWLHQLELLIVKLNPLDTHEPTRAALLEARLLDQCVAFLRDFPNCADLCASSLAILVYMSLNEETSEQLATNHEAPSIRGFVDKILSRELGADRFPPTDIVHLTCVLSFALLPSVRIPLADSFKIGLNYLHGYEAVAALLKVYYNRCVELATKRAEQHTFNRDQQKRKVEQLRVHTSTGRETFSGDEGRANTETAETSPPPDGAGRTATCAVRPQTQDNANRGTTLVETTPQTEEIHTEERDNTLQAGSGMHQGPHQCEINKESNLPAAPDKRQEPQTRHATASEDCGDSNADITAIHLNSEALLVELLTLIWRIIFASSLDGDEYAQIWVAAGAAEPAIECLASDLPAFSSSSFVCWVFGALRFLPLDNAALCVDFVQHRRLFEFIIKKMEMHCAEPMLMENGFAVLANYQRNHPAHTAILCKIPQVWQKCVNWLRKSELFYAPDTVYQGLYAIGLACSYNPTACIGLKQAGGIDLATRLSAAYEIFPSPEFRLDSTPDAGLSPAVSSGCFEEEHLLNDDDEEDANAGSAARDSADTAAHFVNADAAAVAASADIEPLPGAGAAQDSPPGPDALGSRGDCTTEKLRIIFQFAEGLIRLLESCPATADRAPRSLQEEAITEEDEEISDEEDEEEEEDSVESIEEGAKTPGRRGRASKGPETEENPASKGAEVAEVVNILPSSQRNTSVNAAHEDLSGKTVQPESACRALQKNDSDTSVRKEEKLLAFPGRAEGSKSYVPLAEFCVAQEAGLSVREKQEKEDAVEQRSRSLIEMSSERELGAEASDVECSKVSSLEEETTGNAKQKEVYAVRTPRVVKPAGLVAGEKHWKKSPPNHDQMEVDLSTKVNASTNDEEQGGQTGHEIDSHFVTASGELTPLQQTDQEAVGRELYSRTQADVKGDEFHCPEPLRLSENSQGDRCGEENVTMQGGGAASSAPRAPSSTRDGPAGAAKSVGSAEDHERLVELPESGGTWGPDQTPSRMLLDTTANDGGTRLGKYGGEDEKRVKRGSELETDNEEDLHFHFEETLLLLPSCGEAEYTKCPTCELDAYGRENETSKEVEDEKEKNNS